MTHAALATRTIRLRNLLGHFGYVATLGLASVIATLIGAVVGTAIIFALLNIVGVIAIMLNPMVVVYALAQGALYAAPVTFGMLPLGAFALRKRRLTLQLALPVIGCLGGGLTMWIWPILQLGTTGGPGGIGMLAGTGALAGLAAGAFYGHVMAEE